MFYRCFNLELISVLDYTNVQHITFKITEAVSYFSKPVFLKSNIFDNFKIHFVASGTLLTEYFTLSNGGRNDCSQAAICLCDFLQGIKGSHVDALWLHVPNTSAVETMQTWRWRSTQNLCPQPREHRFCPCVHGLGKSKCKWVFNHAVTCFGGVNTHLLLISPG